ncbi:major facilitator superfamily domain-containing protein [Cadophora sp. MPI-SDFR-AT-0126]|nr:major facilitator superfamily domain-containing protein [Leotiomycetes sp. MPI-SDFR-AT-0126]
MTPTIEDNKDELKNAIATGNTVAENVITLDALKDIDEEAHYAIAYHQSYLNPRSKEAFTLYLFLLVSFLNATSSGFDGSLMGSINAQDQYKTYFHLKETGSSTGLVFILHNAASMVGCAFGGPVMDYFGGRRGMQSGCLFTLGGAITPPQWGGRLGGYYNTFYFVGQRSITATGVAYATSQYPDTLVWRLPLVRQVIPPFLVFVGWFFIPESPRWLTSRDRMDECANIIYKYHGGEDNEVAKLEMREVALHVKLSKPQIFQPTMLAAVGVTSVRRKPLLTFASSIVSCSGAVLGSATNDWIPRRTRSVWGSFSLAAAPSLVAAMSSQVAAATSSGSVPSKAASGVGIFAIFLYGYTWSLYCTEVLNQEIRAKDISLHALVRNLATILLTYTTSIALGDISRKYYFVWIAVDFTTGFLWFFFGVETVGRTIEELDACFEAKFPPRASWKRTKSVKDENKEIGIKIAYIGA